MLTPQNISENNILAAYSARAPQPVLSAIKVASAKTGVDFAYMVQQADAESSFRADAKAKTSSARGLYQFIESTWLSMVEKHGASHGIETEGKSRSDLLKLRDDPEMASFMAAELARENRDVLEQNWAKGRKEIGATELYFAHFLGAGGASAFLNARDSDGNATAAHIFPAAAKANKNVFYERSTGRAKSLDEVYAFFERKFDLEQKLDGFAPDTPSPVRTKQKTPHAGSLFAANDVHGIMLGFTSKNSVLDSFAPPKKPNFGGFNAIPITNLISSPVEMMLLAQLETPYDARHENKQNRL